MDQIKANTFNPTGIKSPEAVSYDIIVSGGTEGSKSKGTICEMGMELHRAAHIV